MDTKAVQLMDIDEILYNMDFENPNTKLAIIQARQGIWRAIMSEQEVKK